jgi:hypothetical protein
MGIKDKSRDRPSSRRMLSAPLRTRYILILPTTAAVVKPSCVNMHAARCDLRTADAVYEVRVGACDAAESPSCRKQIRQFRRRCTRERAIAATACETYIEDRSPFRAECRQESVFAITCAPVCTNHTAAPSKSESACNRVCRTMAQPGYSDRARFGPA